MKSNQPWWLSGLMSQSNKSRIAQNVPGSNPVHDLEMLNMFGIKNEYIDQVSYFLPTTKIHISFNLCLAKC